MVVKEKLENKLPSKPKPKKSTGDINTFLRRNFGTISDLKNDNSGFKPIEFGFLSHRSEYRPMKEFQILHPQQQVGEHTKTTKLTDAQITEWGIQIDNIIKNIAKWMSKELKLMVSSYAEIPRDKASKNNANH